MESVPDRHRRAMTCLYIIAAVILAISMIGSGIAFLSRFQQSDDRRTQQIQVNRLIASQALQNCLEIENLKEGQRTDAIIEYNHLERNLKLLGLKKTPEIVQAAVEQRDRKLDKYAKQPCPRKIKRIAHK